MKLLSILSLLLGTISAAFAIPAFPGAEGFGSDTPGGRGGRVIEVTNLNDSGPGSFRAACETEGPRIVVFRVGGTIRLKKHIRISNPFITIAGQTAPGDGILLRDAGLVIRTHDVVIRYVRVRIGESRVEKPDSQDCVNIGGKEDDLARNVIIDHCSFSWALDENADSYSRASDITFQWCIFSEGLANSIHPKGKHSMGLLLGETSTRISIHHCLFAHNNQRSPRFKGGLRDFVNNVIYDWGDYPAAFSDDPRVNFVANYYKPGPSSRKTSPIITGLGGMGSIYLKDNHFPGEKSEWDQVQSDGGAIRAEEPYEAPKVTVCSAQQAYVKVLAGAGCRYPRRDSVDARIVTEVREGSGRIIDRPEQVGGFPEIRGGEAPSDRDHDGMPDSWETSHGLDPDDPSDGSRDRDGDGYTNIEEYTNGLVRAG